MKQKQPKAKGLVIEALADCRFRVLTEEKREFICYLCGKMRCNNVNVRVGDRVEFEIDPAGGKATNRIIYRF